MRSENNDNCPRFEYENSMPLERYLSYRHFLADELKQRQSNDRKYSVRTLAKELGVRSSRLTEILQGKVGISEDRATDIAEKLRLPEDERKVFVDLVQSVHGRGTVTKKIAKERLRQRFPEARELQLDEFELIADWYHLAILELLDVEGFEAKPEFIARKLAIPVEAATQAVERLMRLGLLRNEDGVYKRADSNRTTTQDIPSGAIRSYHRQILEKAEKALDERDVTERDFSSLVFSIPKEKVPVLKDFILRMCREFDKELEIQAATPAPKESVYCFSTQFFELTE